MADQTRKDEPARDRERGFGDDQGTRIGRPDQPPVRAGEGDEGSGNERTGPSTRPVKEGLEGAIFEDGDDSGRRGSTEGGAEGATSSPQRAQTGSGSEAAEGLHAAGGRGESQRSGVENVRQGNPDETPGSQPMRGRTYEHRGGYGGEGGEPR